MSDIDWPAVHRVRRAIAEHERELELLYLVRTGLIRQMAQEMGQREVGSYWQISQPRVKKLLDRE